LFVLLMAVCTGAQTAPHWDDVSSLMKALGRTNDSREFLRVAERLRELKAVQSMPVLVSSLERGFALEKFEPHPAKTALVKWSWQAVGPALRGLRSPSRSVRLGCAEVLLARAPYGPRDARLFPAYVSLIRSPDLQFRRIGAYALADYAVRPRIDRMGDGWLPFDILSLPALAELAKRVLDPEPEIQSVVATRIHGLLWSRGAGAPRLYASGPVDRELAHKEREQYARFLKDKEPGMRIAALTMTAYGSGPVHALYDARNDPVKEVREVARALSVPSSGSFEAAYFLITL